jgi:hypothetical protein
MTEDTVFDLASLTSSGDGRGMGSERSPDATGN